MLIVRFFSLILNLRKPSLQKKIFLAETVFTGVKNPGDSNETTSDFVGSVEIRESHILALYKLIFSQKIMNYINFCFLDCLYLWEKVLYRCQKTYQIQ